MPTYKLCYFDAKGKGELIRFIFCIAGVEFEDERLKYNGEVWKEMKPNTPFGQLPILTVDGNTINQSGAIIRYLAREFGLYGNRNLENSMCDVILETFNDLMIAVYTPMFEKSKEKQEEQYEHLRETVLPKFFKLASNMIKENGNSKGYLVGSTLSIADIAVFDMCDRITSNPVLGDAVLEGYDEIKNICKEVRNIPNILKYLENRKITRT